MYKATGFLIFLELELIVKKLNTINRNGKQIKNTAIEL